MQLMDICAGVLPGLVLGAVGYKGNGGCTCGCGVKCPAPYLRWSCPADRGYACTSELSDDNWPIFGPPERRAPCTFQAESVDTTLQLFFFTIPAICFALSTFFAVRAPISGDVHRQIRSEIKRREQGHLELYDPVTRDVIHEDQSSDKDTAVMHAVTSFSQAEQALLDGDAGVQKLQLRIAFNLTVTISGVVGLNVGMKILHVPKALNTVAFFASSLVVMLVVWQILKLTTAFQSAQVLKGYANAQRFARSGGKLSSAAAASSAGPDELGSEMSEDMQARVLNWLHRTRFKPIDSQALFMQTRRIMGDRSCDGASPSNETGEYGRSTFDEESGMAPAAAQRVKRTSHDNEPLESGTLAGLHAPANDDREAPVQSQRAPTREPSGRRRRRADSLDGNLQQAPRTP